MSCCGTGLDHDEKTAGAALVAPAEIGRIANDTPPARAAFAGGRSHVGTDKPEILPDGEGPKRPVTLAPFAVEATLVTNARFAAFVLDTGYRTVAEQFGWAPVFRPFLDDPNSLPPGNMQTPWWGKGDGAAWFAPEGPGSHVLERADHPVVHIAWDDARAFAAWAGGRLGTEAEWEHAARGGLADPRFPWGDEEPDDDTFQPCNIWQGRFPTLNTKADGWAGTAPVASFAANGAGLYDMAGNVWEWTADTFRVRSLSRAAKMRNEQSRLQNVKVAKGGSFLCHKSYCYRYRIAARSGVAADSGTSNTGMRIFFDG